jgi:hypothetical protein
MEGKQVPLVEERAHGRPEKKKKHRLRVDFRGRGYGYFTPVRDEIPGNAINPETNSVRLSDNKSCYLLAVELENLTPADVHCRQGEVIIVNYIPGNSMSDAKFI